MLNKIQFIGHLGRDPEIKYTASGAAVCNFSVASTEKWKSKDGEKMEATEWLRCNAFDKLAEICGEWLKKGALVYVEGALKTRKWQDKDGKDVFATECRVTSMKMLGGRQGADEGGGEQRQTRQAQAPAPAPQRASAQARQPASGYDDDIPF